MNVSTLKEEEHIAQGVFNFEGADCYSVERIVVQPLFHHLMENDFVAVIHVLVVKKNALETHAL